MNNSNRYINKILDLELTSRNKLLVGDDILIEQLQDILRLETKISILLLRLQMKVKKQWKEPLKALEVLHLVLEEQRKKELFMEQELGIKEKLKEVRQ